MDKTSQLAPPVSRVAFVLILTLALFLPPAARAQDGFLRKPPAPGKEVVVTQSTSGTEVRGRIVELSPTALAMLVDGKRVDMPMNTILRIEGPTDSVKDGAFIGAGVFLGLIALSSATIGAEGSNRGQAILFFTGIGALVGAGIDAGHQGRATIYSKPPSTMSFGVAPRRKGARAQFIVSW
jgi:hypothetical protein